MSELFHPTSEFFVVLPGEGSNPGIYDHGPTAVAQVEGYPEGRVLDYATLGAAELCWDLNVAVERDYYFGEVEEGAESLVVFLRRPYGPAIRYDVEGEAVKRIASLLRGDA